MCDFDFDSLDESLRDIQSDAEMSHTQNAIGDILTKLNPYVRAQIRREMAMDGGEMVIHICDHRHIWYAPMYFETWWVVLYSNETTISDICPRCGRDAVAGLLPEEVS